MRLALCNEVIRELDFPRQCALAAKLGYGGIEIAPFTLGEEAYRMGPAQRAEIRRALGDAGLVCSGLHWLLAAPAGLSITTAETGRYQRTLDVIRALVDLCAELGGSYLVHGSPQQRKLSIEADPEAARARAEAAWALGGERAAKAGVTYLIEPLARAANGEFGTDLVNTVAEAVAVIERTRAPSLKTMIDACAATDAETEPMAALVRRWMPSGHVAHIHLNDRNRRGPGEGADRFHEVITALKETRYVGWIGLEPFVYEPDGPTCAARSIGYVHGLIEAAGL